MNDEQKKVSNAEEDEIDLIALAKNIWKNRKFIIKTVVLFALIGIVIALVSPKQYTASTTMVPQISGGSSKMGGLSSLASMAGVNLNLGQEGTELLPQMYPQIVQSIPFQLQLMKEDFYFSDVKKTANLLEYYTQYYRPGFLSLAKKYTIGLPGLLIKSVVGTNKGTAEVDGAKMDAATIKLTEEQELVRRIIADNISIEVQEQDGYIQLNSKFHEPELAAQVAKKAQELLQEYITEFKVEKATAQLEFIKERYQEKKDEFEKAQQALAIFRDQNKNVTSAMALTEQERLQNEYQLAFQVYSNLAQQLEQARIKVKEDTPVFSVIQPVTVPFEKSKPKRSLILVIWVFLGFIIGIGWVFANQFLTTAKGHWQEIE